MTTASLVEQVARALMYPRIGKITEEVRIKAEAAVAVFATALETAEMENERLEKMVWSMEAESILFRNQITELRLHAENWNGLAHKFQNKAAELRRALEEIAAIDIADKGLPASRIARAALASKD